MPIESFNPLFSISLLESIESIKSLGSSDETDASSYKQGEDEEKDVSTKEKIIEVIREEHNIGGEDNNREHTRDILPDNPFDTNPDYGGGSPWEIKTPTEKRTFQDGIKWTQENRTQMICSQGKQWR